MPRRLTSPTLALFVAGVLAIMAISRADPPRAEKTDEPKKVENQPPAAIVPDPAFAPLVSDEILRSVAESDHALSLAEAALLVARGERILQRPHKGLPYEKLAAQARKAAEATSDAAALKKLDEAAREKANSPKGLAPRTEEERKAAQLAPPVLAPSEDFPEPLPLDLIAEATDLQSPDLLIDAALLVAEAERVAGKYHPAMPSDLLLEKAAGLAGLQRTPAALDRLAGIAERRGDKAFGDRVANLQKLTAVPRAASPLSDPDPKFTDVQKTNLQILARQLREAEQAGDLLKLQELKAMLAGADETAIPAARKTLFLKKVGELEAAWKDNKSEADSVGETLDMLRSSSRGADGIWRIFVPGGEAITYHKQPRTHIISEYDFVKVYWGKGYTKSSIAEVNQGFPNAGQIAVTIIGPSEPSEKTAVRIPMAQQARVAQLTQKFGVGMLSMNRSIVTGRRFFSADGRTAFYVDPNDPSVITTEGGDRYDINAATTAQILGVALTEGYATGIRVNDNGYTLQTSLNVPVYVTRVENRMVIGVGNDGWQALVDAGVFKSGSAAISRGAGSIVGVGAAGNIVAVGAGNIVAVGAGNIVAVGAGNIVAVGAGNIVAVGAASIVAPGASGIVGPSVAIVPRDGIMSGRFVQGGDGKNRLKYRVNLGGTVKAVYSPAKPVDPKMPPPVKPPPPPPRVVDKDALYVLRGRQITNLDEWINFSYTKNWTGFVMIFPGGMNGTESITEMTHWRGLKMEDLWRAVTEYDTQLKAGKLSDRYVGPIVRGPGNSQLRFSYSRVPTTAQALYLPVLEVAINRDLKPIVTAKPKSEALDITITSNWINSRPLYDQYGNPLGKWANDEFTALDIYRTVGGAEEFQKLLTYFPPAEQATLKQVHQRIGDYRGQAPLRPDAFRVGRQPITLDFTTAFGEVRYSIKQKTGPFKPPGSTTEIQTIVETQCTYTIRLPAVP